MRWHNCTQDTTYYLVSLIVLLNQRGIRFVLVIILLYKFQPKCYLREIHFSIWGHNLFLIYYLKKKIAPLYPAFILPLPRFIASSLRVLLRFCDTFTVDVRERLSHLVRKKRILSPSALSFSLSLPRPVHEKNFEVFQ